MDQLSPTTLGIVTAFISLGSVIVGALLTLAGNIFMKRQERFTELSKLIAEKRLAAYEEVISKVRFASIAVSDLKETGYAKQPLILDDLDSYHRWSAEYIVMCRRVTHLIDRELDHKLWIFQNYLLYLDRALEHFTGPDGKYSSPEAAQRFGSIIYDDFRRLTSDVLQEAGKFYNKKIFKTFTPASASISMADYKLPSYFSTLALFSKAHEIESLSIR